MSAITAVNSMILNASSVTDLLAIQEGGLPAVYDSWLPPDAVMPCVTIRWSFTREDPYIKNRSSVLLDVWDRSASTIRAEQIRNEVYKVLDQARVTDVDDGYIRLYADRDGTVPEEPGTVHWWMELTAVFYSPLQIKE